VSFQVGRGEFAFLTGPSGSGKSTILKLIYMDEMPTRGAVWVGGTKSPGVRSASIPQLRRKLGVVFQDFLLLDDRTVEQNVAFALEVVDTPRERIGSKVSRLLTRVGLASKATNYPRELSGGEQQRVVSRARERPVVLLPMNRAATSMTAPPEASSSSSRTSTRQALRSSWQHIISSSSGGTSTAYWK
jgi:cell division transport system ATP-binding protein